MLGRDCVEDEVFFFLVIVFWFEAENGGGDGSSRFFVYRNDFFKNTLDTTSLLVSLRTCTPAFSYLKWSEARPVGLRGVFRPWRVSSSLAKPWRNVSDARCARSQAGRDVRKLIGVDRILDGFG